MRGVDRFAAFVAGHTKAVIAVMLVVTVVVGYGVTMIPPTPQEDATELIDETPELTAVEYVLDRYATEDETVSTIQVYVRSTDGGDVLSKDSLLASLRYQEALYADETVSETLVTDHTPVIGVANVVATAAMGRSEPTLTAQIGDVPLADQVAALESMSETEVETLVATVLSGRPDAPAGGEAIGLLPVDFAPGSTQADARGMLVTRYVGEIELGAPFPDAVFDGERRMAALADERPADGDQYFLTTNTVLFQEDAVATNDSLLLVVPLALLLILLALSIAYRDVLDITLGLAGTAIVLVWTFGLMGWVGIPADEFTSIVVPVLLIGLSIDYSIHTFMRHREERVRDVAGDASGSHRSSREAMRFSLAGVGLALVWVTVTAGVGFLSNLTSDFETLRNFGLATSLGLVSALAVFTTLIPALKIELDGVFSRFSRRATPKKAFGTAGGAIGRVLSLGTVAARRAPTLVIALALVTTGVGAYGGLQLEASVDQEIFADDPPAWMKNLPEPFSPGEYTAREKLAFVDDRFTRGDDTTLFVLVEGAVTDDEVLERLAAGEAVAADSDAVLKSDDGRSPVTSPLSLLRSVAAVDPELGAAYQAADTDGNGVPDRDVAALYDRLFVVAPDAASTVIERTDDGEYASLLVSLPTRGDVDSREATVAIRDVSDAVDADSAAITATPTGARVILSITIESLMNSVLVTLFVTLGVVILLLTIGYRIAEGSATLGFVTLLPVAFGVAWFFGTLWALNIDLNLLTSVIASITVGLGVDYSIHLSERYKQELARHGSVWKAMETTTTGTGGALVGGFATTVAAFATLALATSPGLQQFGVLIALALVYAFGSTMLLLPSLLAVWTRHFGPADVSFEPHVPARPPVPTADDESPTATADDD
jgi:predicted RND superfamily exporter protein